MVGTNPAAGSQVTSGATIQLITSSGGCPATVPYLLGKSSTTAQSVLQAAGFVVVEDVAPANLCTTAQVGEVVTQSVRPWLLCPLRIHDHDSVLPERRDNRRHRSYRCHHDHRSHRSEWSEWSDGYVRRDCDDHNDPVLRAGPRSNGNGNG